MGTQTIKLGKDPRGESNFKIELINSKIDKDMNNNERPLTKFKYKFLNVEYSSSGKLFIFLFKIEKECEII